MCLAVPGRLIEFSKNTEIPADGATMGKVDFGGIMKSVCLDLVPEAKIGDYVVVHVGFAISILNEEEAEESLRLFSELEAFQQQPQQDDSARKREP